LKKKTPITLWFKTKETEIFFKGLIKQNDYEITTWLLEWSGYKRPLCPYTTRERRPFDITM